MTFSYKILKTLIACAILATPWAAGAVETGYYAQTSALATGRWVKIKVDRAGMQQITAEELAEAGFNDPERVGVYGYSTVDISDHALTDAKPDDLPAIPSIVSDGKLIFYAEGGYREGVVMSSQKKLTPAYAQNPSSLAGYYFLREEDSPVRLEMSTDEASDSSPETSFPVLRMKKFMDRYPTNAGTLVLSDNVVELPDRKYVHSFDIVRPNPDILPTYHISYVAYGAEKDAKISVSYPNGIYTYTLSGSTPSLYTRAYTNSATMSKLDKDGEANMILAVRTDKVTYAAIHYMGMIYQRMADFADGEAQISFYIDKTLEARRGIAFTNAMADSLEVWDLSTPKAPIRLNIKADGGNSALAVNHTPRSADSPGRYIAFKPSMSLNSVEFAGEVANSDLHAMSPPDLLIISTPGLLPAAERLAAIHREHQGLEVAVADHESIYNEFSSGTPSADGLRRFIKMLYDRAPEKLRNVVLLGESSTNLRGIDTDLKIDPSDIIPTFPTEEVSNQFDLAKSYSTDVLYGCMADGTTTALKAVMNINVGRIPAANLSEANSYIDKAEHYMAVPTGADVRSRVLSISDRGNNNGHTLQAIELGKAIEQLAPDTHIIRAYDPVYDYTGNNPTQHHSVIADWLRQGVGLMTYCGHGNKIFVGSAPLWGRRNVQSTTMSAPPFVMLSTCDTYLFDRPDFNIGKDFIITPEAGAIALIASCREVQMSLNQALTLEVAKEYFAPSSDTATLGDIFRRARNAAVAQPLDNIVPNTLCYNFGGDPALPLYNYTHSILLDDNQLSLTPLGDTNRISGSVTTPDGDIDDSFDGTLVADIYTPPYTVNAFKHASSDTLKQVRLDGDLIATTYGRIEGGHFNLNLELPPTATPGTDYKVHLAALRDSSHQRGAVTLRSLTVTEPANTLPADWNAPDIKEIQIVNTTYVNGLYAAGDMTLNARWEAQHAISFCGVTTASHLMVDGKRYPIKEYVTRQPDGDFTLDFPLNDIDGGLHEATLVVIDIAGQEAEDTIEFTVAGNHPSASIAVEGGEVVTDELTITADHTFGAEPWGRLSVIDRNGLTVYSVENPSFPLTWDLNDPDGNRVADGRYIIRAWLHHNNRYTEASSADVVIIEP